MVNGILSLIGRTCIIAIFAFSAIGNKIPNFENVASAMASQDIPFPSVMLVGAIVFMILGSLSVILGYKTNTGCILLLIFLVAATYYFHDFWNFSGGERQKQLIQFLKNVSIFGGILFILANGTGNFSLKKR